MTWLCLHKKAEHSVTISESVKILLVRHCFNTPSGKASQWCIINRRTSTCEKRREVCLIQERGAKQYRTQSPQTDALKQLPQFINNALIISFELRTLWKIYRDSEHNIEIPLITGVIANTNIAVQHPCLWAISVSLASKKKRKSAALTFQLQEFIQTHTDSERECQPQHLLTETPLSFLQRKTEWSCLSLWLSKVSILASRHVHFQQACSAWPTMQKHTAQFLVLLTSHYSAPQCQL